MGKALKSLIIGIGLLAIYYIFLEINQDNIPNDMSGLAYMVPIMIIVFVTVSAYIFGFVSDLRNPELSLTLKIIEGIIGVFVLAGFLWFYQQIN